MAYILKKKTFIEPDPCENFGFGDIIVSAETITTTTTTLPPTTTTTTTPSPTTTTTTTAAITTTTTSLPPTTTTTTTTAAITTTTTTPSPTTTTTTTPAPVLFGGILSELDISGHNTGTLSTSTGYITGYDGTTGYIFKTIDGGGNYNGITLPTLGPYLSAPSTTTVYYGKNTQDFIYKSIDSGQNWSDVTPSTLNTNFNIMFIDDNYGFVGDAGGAQNKIHRTIDGGSNWTEITVSGTRQFQDQTNFYFTSRSTGFISARETSTNTGVIMKTTDSGSTWTTVHDNGLATVGINFITFASSSVGYADDTDGRIYKTTDGGNNWSTGSTTTVNQGAKELGFFTNSLGFVWSNTGDIWWKTTDGAANWTDDTSSFPSYSTGGFLARIEVANSTVGRALNSRFNDPLAWYTNNAGTTWTKSDLYI